MAKLDFGNGAFSIFFILPFEGILIDDIIKSLDNTLLSSLESETLQVNLRIPKFKFDPTVDLIQPLQKCGITNLFDSENADMKNITEKKCHINLIRQNCNFSINETGVIATGATVSGEYITSPGLIKNGGDFFLDRPFMFMIRENNSHTYLFMGKVENI